MGSSRMIVSVLVECRYTEQCAIPPFVARKEPTEPVEQVSIRNRVDLRKIGIFAKKNESDSLQDLAPDNLERRFAIHRAGRN